MEGPARFSNLADYYWAENGYIADSDSKVFATITSQALRRPRHALTLVAGAAGVGKTFFKNDIFRKDYPSGAVCKFDVRELYNEWQHDGTVVMKPDLSFDQSVINSLPALADPHSTRLTEYLESNDAAFYVIDSLDELHPDEYDSVLRQVEEFVFHNDRPFVHAVDLRPITGFRGLLATKKPDSTRPLTDGISRCSSCSHRVFARRATCSFPVGITTAYEYKLTWSPDGGSSTADAAGCLCEMGRAGFIRTGPFASVQSDANQNMRPDVHFALLEWTQHHRIVGSMLYNLAGNSILREIVESHVIEDRPVQRAGCHGGISGRMAGARHEKPTIAPAFRTRSTWICTCDYSKRLQCDTRPKDASIDRGFFEVQTGRYRPRFATKATIGIFQCVAS